MKILFQDRTLEKAYNNQSLLIRKYGPIRAKLLKCRLDDLENAENLEEMHSLPQARCHELKGTVVCVEGAQGLFESRRS